MADTYEVRSALGDLSHRSNVVEAKDAKNRVRKGKEFAWDGGSQYYRGALAEGFNAARGGATQQPPLVQGRPGSNPRPLAPVPDDLMTERPGSVYERAQGADVRTSPFGASNPQPHWVRDKELLAPFAYSSNPQNAGAGFERPGTVVEVQPSGQGGRRPNEAQVR
jgi:hypothetical protein